MQIGLRQGLVNAALIGPKGAAALQDQCYPLERRTLGRDMGLAQQRLTARHDAPPVFTARVAHRLVAGLCVTLALGQALCSAAHRRLGEAFMSCVPWRRHTGQYITPHDQTKQRGYRGASGRWTVSSRSVSERFLIIPPVLIELSCSTLYSLSAD